MRLFIMRMLLILLGLLHVTTVAAFQSVNRADACTSRFSTRLLTTTSSSSSSSSSSSRVKRMANLSQWAASVGIQIGSLNVSPSTETTGGLGLVASKDVATPNTVLLSVPSNVALSVGDNGPDLPLKDVAITDSKVLRNAPWFVQFSIYLQSLEKISSQRPACPEGMKPWLDTLPRSFSTPLHFSQQSLQELHYTPMVESVTRQKIEWKQWYQQMETIATPPLLLSWDDFCWGCECARSRAFSGYAAVSGGFNPLLYAFTLLLVTIYVGMGLGTVEQAANGAGVVFCAIVFNDFVLPKLFQSKKYVICPMIDMANHASQSFSADVSFEYFGNAYSLASVNNINTIAVNGGAGGPVIPQNQEVFISYGARSNDQLLQYYGFVERNNPHDVYIMPPLREWNITAIEQACGGRSFPTGRLEKLNRAGLLGSTETTSTTTKTKTTTTSSKDDEYNVANPKGGVVITRAKGIDPAVLQALRALVSTDEEWNQGAGEAIGNFAEPMNENNERRALLAAKTQMQLELKSKPTTLQQDLEMYKRQQQQQKKKSSDKDDHDHLALLFRIEKKKLLQETIDNL